MSARARLALCLAALACLGVDRPPGLGDVVEVRHWSYKDYTRVVVELDGPPRGELEVKRLAANPAAKRPERLYLDLSGVWVGRNYEARIEVGDGLLQGVRLGQNTLQNTRVVLDLQQYESHRLLTLSHPDRVVIDVYGKRKRRAPARDAVGRPLPSGMRSVRTVVVDAGHGGRDPGAIGVGGLREKDVTLRLSRALGKRLSDQGFRVVYTRTDDRSLTLEERTAIAESVDGDLFVSVHANASPRRSVHGVETYYLDENHERHAMNLAARENGVPKGDVNVLQQTLAKLHLQEVSPQSRRLAMAVQKAMVKGFPHGQRPVDLGVKKGPFYVLFLSNMPAILVETGFLTHKGEARRLRDDAYLEVMARQIAVGVADYRGQRRTPVEIGLAPSRSAKAAAGEEP